MINFGPGGLFLFKCQLDVLPCPQSYQDTEPNTGHVQDPLSSYKTNLNKILFFG